MIPVREGRWTTAAAAQARVVARMRERGHSLAELRRAVREGRLAFGFVEDLLPGRERDISRAEAAERTGLEEALIERMMSLLGTPTALEGTLNEQDVEAMEQIGGVLGAGFPLVALLQLDPGVRPVDPQDRRGGGAPLPSLRPRAADPPGRRRAADGRGDGGAGPRPARRDLAAHGVHPPALPALLHRAGRRRHMEAELGGQRQLGRVQMAFCFVDLTGFTRYTEEEGDEEAFDLVERFVETVEATLPAEALIVKTIGDEVMIVSPDPVTLTEWAVGFMELFQERPQPRVGLHFGRSSHGR